jgi:aspartate racemase
MMKPIGLLGGTAWPSTIDYYRQLNELAIGKFGQGHSAEINLRSIDYYRLKQYYPDRWEDVARELFTVLKELDQTKPACIVICNNALHKAFDIIPNRDELASPVVHIVDSAVELLHHRQIKRPLFLATKFTMEDGFYTDRLRGEGFDVIVPNEEDRNLIHSIQTKLSKGASPDEFTDSFSDICMRYESSDGILLACTELPMVFRTISIDRPILDPSERQLEIAFQYSCGIR